MDKKNTLLGLVFIGLAFFLMFYQSGRDLQQLDQPVTVTEHREQAETESAPVTGSLVSPQPAAQPQPAATEPGRAPAEGLARTATAAPITAAAETGEEELYVVENDYIRVTFTSRGGAIQTVALKKYRATLESDEPYLFNRAAETPALAISLLGTDGQPVPYEPNFRVARQEGDTIVFVYESEGLEVRRGYRLHGADEPDKEPYLIEHETAFENKGQEDLVFDSFYINAGTALPTEGDIWGQHLNYGYASMGKSKFISINKFNGRSGFLGIGARAPTPEVQEGPLPVEWVAVKNQFFAGVLTPNRQGTGIYAKTIDLGLEGASNSKMGQALSGDIEFALGRLATGTTSTLGIHYYVGPKEFNRLQGLGDPAAGYAGGQDAVMQFGYLSFISKLLLVLMIGIHTLIEPISPVWGWGWTIILVTVLIKGALWPLTAAQVRSAKRMSKIQAPLKELREKYKDNPQRMQQETMKLFRENKVNPAAGCLPILVQIPIFIGLFFMLRTASELRFAEFLWIRDLSLADTVATIGGFPLNILPLLMAVSMFFQMRMTPMPTADNIQRTMFQFMPFIFLIFCYKFPSGLVLYWTTQNLLTILQQWLTNRKKDEPVIIEPVRKGSKNKRPHKKK